MGDAGEMTFGKRLKNLREEKDIMQKELAAAINISPRMISFYENDTHFPRDAATIISIAEFYGVSLDYLFGVSNIKNHNAFTTLYNVYNGLEEAGQIELLDYAKYLKSKHLKKK